MKGRDFYDLLWYLGQNIPVKISYLESKMRDGEQIGLDAKLTREEVVRLLEAKIADVDWEKTKDDIAAFLRDPKELDPWSKEFFLSAIPRLRVD